tara:strand:+ start:42772 stop:43215 length:444 start_codon:yes stop_codon:yes gene_type:complete
MEFISKIEKGKLTFLNEEKVKSFISSIEGKDVVINIKKHKKNRSNAQNRWYWGVALKKITEDLYNIQGELFTKEEIHSYHKSVVIASKFNTLNVLGKEILIFNDVSTKSMNTIQFNDFKQTIQNHWAVRGIDIPDPNEENFINQIGI